MLLFDAGGQLMLMVGSWNLLDMRRAIELMLTFQMGHGQKL